MNQEWCQKIIESHTLHGLSSFDMKLQLQTGFIATEGFIFLILKSV